MAKRRLNRRQAWRIQKIQDERIARAERKAALPEPPETGADLGPEQRGLIIAHYGTQVEVEALEGPHRGQTWRAHLRANLDPLVAEWEKTLGTLIAAADKAWEPFEPLELTSAGGATFRRSEDGTWFVEGNNPPRDSYEFESLLPGQSFGGLLLEVLPDASLADGGFGRQGNGNIVVSKIEVEIEPAQGGYPVPVKLVRAEADYEQKNWPAAAVLTGQKGKGWAIDGNDPAKRQPRQLAVFPAAALDVSENSRLVVRIRQETLDRHNLGRFRLAVTAADPAVMGVAGSTMPPAVTAALAVSRDQRSKDQQEALRMFYREKVDSPIKRAEAAREAAKKSLADFRRKLPTAMVMKEGPPRDAFVLIRGEYDKRG